ncbi:hypothetical protein J7J83_02730 [bacterium]|nr:hypothetical protein [bacterium]
MDNSKDEALQKLSMLSNYQKLSAILNKENDKLDEIRAQESEKEEIQKIKQSLKK